MDIIPTEAWTQATVLIIPGLRDHVEAHWQTHLATQLDKVHSVPPLQTHKLSCAHRVAAIEAQLEKIDGPVIFVAHSAGVLMTVHWAAQHNTQGQMRHNIKGALLVTPPNLAQTWPEQYPSPEMLKLEGWSPLPDQKLAFPSIVAASLNDPLADVTAVTAMANQWGSQMVQLGTVGHLNPAAGFGPWPQALTFIQQLDEALS